MIFNYDLNDTYLMACSGGPDSMALLDMLLKQNYKIIVAHVNYKTRKESDDEERLVKKYCKSHNIMCYVTYFNKSYRGSFEAIAREFRYDFFADLYEKYDCKGLFVAHHKDDLLETYLLKKQRNVVNESYLILKETIIKNMKVLRPLLYECDKEYLLNYCKNNDIPYGIDSSNFSSVHPRNVIRKNLVNANKEMLLKQALKDEEKLINTRNDVKDFIKFYPVYTISLLSEKDDLWLMIFLYELCEKNYKKYIVKSSLLTLKNYLKSDKSNLYYKIADDYYLEKNYQQIAFNHRNINSFSYVFDKLQYVATSNFKIVNSGLKMQGIYVSNDDFPITIRSYNNDDKITLKEGSKKVSRLFIDKKIPLLERSKIPVIENCHHEIIFVYKLYRKYGYKNVKNNLFLDM